MKPEKHYYYRGLVERGAKYTRREAYSANGPVGPLYPWMTYRECQADAKRGGFKAVFHR